MTCENPLRLMIANDAGSCDDRRIMMSVPPFYSILMSHDDDDAVVSWYDVMEADDYQHDSHDHKVQERTKGKRRSLKELQDKSYMKRILASIPPSSEPILPSGILSPHVSSLHIVSSKRHILLLHLLNSWDTHHFCLASWIFWWKEEKGERGCINLYDFSHFPPIESNDLKNSFFRDGLEPSPCFILDRGLDEVLSFTLSLPWCSSCCHMWLFETM